MIAIALRELLDKPEFGSGLAWGLLLAVLGGGFAVIWRLGWERPAPIAGLLVALAFAAATHGTSAVPSNVKWGLLLLAGGGRPPASLPHSGHRCSSRASGSHCRERGC